MSTNLCLKPMKQQQGQQSRLLMDNVEDKTHSSTQGSSKLCENCRLIKQQLQGEIFLLKDKSHQSFMQVIDINSQVQQLHEQELELLRAEHQQQVTALRQQIDRLTLELSRIQEELSAMEINSKHHVVQLDGQSFLIQNIDMIKCMGEEKQEMSRLDQSEVWQFHQIVESQRQEQRGSDKLAMKTIKQQQYQHHETSLVNHQPKQPLSHQLQQTTTNTATLLFQQKLSLLNIRIIQLQSQVQSLTQTNQQLKKQCSRLQLSQKSSKNNYQSLYKESKFMADHIRTLANDKFKLQKRVKQLQREVKGSNTKPYRKSLNFDDKLPTVIFSTPTIINNNNTSRNSHDLLFTSLGYDQHYVVTTSRENSIEDQGKESDNEHQQEKLAQTMTIAKTVSIERFGLVDSKVMQLGAAGMTQSQMLQVSNKDNQWRKSVPSYKKVSHITPSPSPTSFKKPFPISKVSQKPPSQLPKWSHQQHPKQDIIQKSDFMDEIRMQLERKVVLKKTPIADHLQTHRPSSLFIGSRDRRSTTKR